MVDANTLARQMKERYKNGVQNAVSRYADGVKNVDVNPAQKAIENIDVWFARLQEAYRNKTMASKLSRVTLEDWKNATATYGVQAYQTAVNDKAPTKYEKKADALAKVAVDISNQASQIKKVDKASALKRVEIAYDNWKKVKGTI
ncbi:MAG: hypothetical protein JHC38_08850 [Thiotrichales bacterium]|nr:hypothetical protein [Thiotrichales bacterium]